MEGNTGHFVNEWFAGGYRQRWIPPGADPAYPLASTANYAVAAGETLNTPGVPGLSYGRWFGATWSPWLGVVESSTLSPAYQGDDNVISRGTPASTGRGQGTPAAKPGPGADVLEIAPGVYV